MISIERVPKNYGSRVVWQVNFGYKKYEWFWTKRKALDFAKSTGVKDVSIVWYPRNENVKQYGDKIIGHYQADENYFLMEKMRMIKGMRK